MLLALILLHFTALTIANPFHKYPYVFLLDVGNEELEKVNTEQIRISKEGGSLALRYPAIGNGEDIVHVRVSGIDFGTDLKASIVDGGPGYKYVVLVLMGNQGVNFDAVITIQTLPSQNNDEANLQSIDDDSRNSNNHKSEENDPNDSAEDLSDSAESEEASQVSSLKENSELTQESSNVYSYAVNEALSGYGSDVHSSEDDGDENHDKSYNEDNDEEIDTHVPNQENQIHQSNSKLDDYTDDGDTSSLMEYQSQDVHNNDDYESAIDDQNYASDNGNQENVNTNLYKEYQSFKQSLYNEDEIYHQRLTPDGSGTVYIEEPGDNDSQQNLEELFSDDYDEDSRQYSDSNNNNFIDRNDGLAIAY